MTSSQTARDTLTNAPNSWTIFDGGMESATETLLRHIGTDADNGDNSFTASLTADDLNSIEGVSEAIAANEAAYRAYIIANPDAFSSPATAEEILAMVTSVNYANRPFITKWQTTADGESITIPTTGTGYNYDIDCDNDDNYEQTGLTGEGTCTFASAGEHIVQIKGAFPRIYIKAQAPLSRKLVIE